MVWQAGSLSAGSASSRRSEGGCHWWAREIRGVCVLLGNPLGIYVFIDAGLYSVLHMVQKSRCDSRGVWEGRQAGIWFGGGWEYLYDLACPPKFVETWHGALGYMNLQALAVHWSGDCAHGAYCACRCKGSYSSDRMHLPLSTYAQLQLDPPTRQ